MQYQQKTHLLQCYLLGFHYSYKILRSSSTFHLRMSTCCISTGSNYTNPPNTTGGAAEKGQLQSWNI